MTWPAAGAGKIEANHRHVIADIHFAPRRERGCWVRCVCGWESTPIKRCPTCSMDLDRDTAEDVAVNWRDHCAAQGLWSDPASARYGGGPPFVPRRTPV